MPEIAELPAGLQFREAKRDDLGMIIALLAEDPLGQTRESAASKTIGDAYLNAFGAIAADPNQRLIVVETDGKVAGCLQLTFIPGLTYTGGTRAQIEGVRIDKSLRGSGAGRAMVEYAIELARERGCVLFQLTTDKRRPEALGFYQALGFTASHEGMKLRL